MSINSVYFIHLSFIILFGSVTDALSQTKKDAWDVNDPKGTWQWQQVKFTTNEGTWMNLDVSPDGSTIVFDMLGDIYSIPMSGGKAIRIKGDISWDVQPRYNKDGSKMLFTSDAGGGDNIWIMNPDGSEAKQITKEKFRLLNNASWTPDGDYFAARKHFTSQRSLGAGEIWLYHKTGGQGYQLTKRKNDQQDVNEPVVSNDGRYVYFSEDAYPGGFFQYNKDPNSQIYVIKRYDRDKGEIKTLISGPGGACRPQISNDDKKIAFIRRIRTKTTLSVYHLETGETFDLFDKLSKDQQEAWAIFGTYPGYSWTPDNEFIVIYGLGKIWKVNATTGEYSEIPFEVDVDTKVANTLKFKNDAFTDSFEAKVLRGLVTSPDESQVIYNAIGKLWVRELDNGAPRRLTNSDHFEFEPSYSADGQSIAFVSWSDEELGAIHILRLSDETTTKVTTEKGIFRTPKFSPDGQTLVYQKEGGNSHQGFTYCQEPGIYTIPISGGDSKLISPQGSFPQFTADGKRIIFQSGGYIFGNLTKSIKSTNLNGKDPKDHFDGKYTQKYVISPDNRWVAWSELYKVYIAPFPKTGKKIMLTKDTKSLPVSQVARDAGINIHWNPSSSKLYWTLGNEYFSNELSNRFKFLEGAIDSIPPMDTVGITIRHPVIADKATGIIAFINASVITMKSDEVCTGCTVLVKDNIITDVGADVTIPSTAHIIDCQDKTIMPGIIDAHAHSGNFRYGLSPQKQWEYYANLAYGVTTSHDPSANTEMVFAQSELIKAGEMIGPRLFSTGTILYGADGDFKAEVKSLDDARSAIRRTKAFGAFSVKSYNQPRRDQRQQVIQAAREENVIVVPEGGSFFFHNMSMVMDGHTGIEHNIPVAPLYRDVIEFWAATKAHNTPTLVVNYAGKSGEYYWYQHSNVWEKERLLSFTPRGIIDSRSRHREMIPEEEYQNGHILTSQSLKKLSDRGVKINLGAHGQLQGLGAHWELWMIQQGGMSNMEALRAATINGAQYLGMDHQIGSIEKGKLADLIVIDGDPLANIRDTENVTHTMINGRLYDANTLNEIGNTSKKRGTFYFEKEGSGNAYPYFIETNSHLSPTCCHKG